MGNYYLAEWSVVIYHDPIDLLDFHTYSFTGTSAQSKIITDKLIKDWNEKHPDTPVTDYERCLSYLPPDYVKKNNYPIEFTYRY